MNRKEFPKRRVRRDDEMKMYGGYVRKRSPITESRANSSSLFPSST